MYNVDLDCSENEIFFSMCIQHKKKGLFTICLEGAIDSVSSSMHGKVKLRFLECLTGAEPNACNFRLFCVTISFAFPLLLSDKGRRGTPSKGLALTESTEG
jgi:hypothetical protein